MTDNYRGMVAVVILILTVFAIFVGPRVLSKGDGGFTINIVSKTEYVPGMSGQIIVELRDRQYNAINASCLANILYPDKSFFIRDGQMVDTVLGTKYVNFTVPLEVGVYEYSVNCTYNNKDYLDGSSFHVSESGKELEYEGPYGAKLNENITSGWRSEGREIAGFCCNSSKTNGTVIYGPDNMNVKYNWFSDATIYRGGQSVNLQCQVALAFDKDNVYVCEQDNVSQPMGCGSDCFSVGIDSYNCSYSLECDGNWSTYQWSQNEDMRWYVPIPKEATSIIWKLRVACQSCSGFNEYTNRTLAAGCWQNQSMLILQWYTFWDGDWLHYRVWDRCWDYTAAGGAGNWTGIQWYSFGNNHFGMYDSSVLFYVPGATEIVEVNEYVELGKNVRAWIER
jgi:hypothetical protein